MTMNPLPPQAYTKDTLLKAYQWLTTQNSSIKEIATTPDILVSLYLKATRDGDSALDRPSIQNFKHELKSLAGMMGELDRPIAIPSTGQQTKTSPAPSSPPPATNGTNSLGQTSTSFLELLDESSQSMIHEVKIEFNLSSDVEALRLLIKVGHTRSKALLRP